jgi:poly-gamma-glutamate capsule biosynthesis protein CapA/YwtB (metallophosphatase superfamily)
MPLLPTRLRRRVEQISLWSMRFRPSVDAHEVGSGPPTASILAAGDVVLSRDIEEAIRHRGPATIFAPLKPVLDGCDLRVANLESPLTRGEVKPAAMRGGLKAAPESVEALAAAGFDAVTVANNHCMDFGPEGLLECLRVLDGRGIAHCGAGDSPRAARGPALLNARGLRVGMLGYADDYRAAIPLDAAAGPAPARDDLILEDVAALRPTVDLVILQLHWGVEFAMYPWLSHRDRARRFVEAGADLILCHHAHVPMGIEVWKRGLIAYGLGNLVFPASRHLAGGHPWSYRSLVLKVFFGHGGISHAQIIPVEVRPDFSVAPSTGGRRAEMLGAITRTSRGLPDAARLARLETEQLTRETLGWSSTFEDQGGLTANQLAEMATLLTAPRQRHVIAWLQEQSSASARAIGDFLASLAAHADAPARIDSHAWQARHHALRSSVATFASEFRTVQSFSGKLP